MKPTLLLPLVLLARASCSEPPQPPEPQSATAGSEAAPAGDGGTIARTGATSTEATVAGDGGTHRERPAQISARHILVMYRGSRGAPAAVTRTRDEARTRAEEMRRRATAGEDFGALAARFSDEPGSGTSRGDLGSFGHGQMVPAFERAAFDLEVNQISDVVETPFGFHVIQRTQ
jgi:hypothetical protein